MKELMKSCREGFERSRPVLLCFSIVLMLGVFSPRVLQARQVYFGSETESVTVAYGAPTLFRFPSEVKTISQAQKFKIEPANSEQPNYALLSVTPRFTTGSSDVAFILGDGTVIKVRIRITAQAIPEKTDSIFDFKSKESLIDSGEGKPGGTVMSEFELMRAMLRGDQVVG